MDRIPVYTGLIYFDYLLTFPNEIKCIWKRERIDGGTILLGIIRYATLLDATIRLVYLMSWVTQSEAEADLVRISLVTRVGESSFKTHRC